MRILGISDREGQLALEFPGDGALIPLVAAEVSGTALAAALLRDGWSVSFLIREDLVIVDSIAGRSTARLF